MAEYVRFSAKLTDSLEQVEQIIRDNQATLDAIQEIALSLTQAVNALGKNAIYYIKMIDAILDTVGPIITKLPGMNKKIVAFVTDAQKLSQQLLDTWGNAEPVINDVESGLTHADPDKLKAHLGDLDGVTRTLQGLLPKTR
jgi:ABC-type transporter Mla subunit MlaD